MMMMMMVALCMYFTEVLLLCKGVKTALGSVLLPRITDVFGLELRSHLSEVLSTLAYPEAKDTVNVKMWVTHPWKSHIRPNRNRQE